MLEAYATHCNSTNNKRGRTIPATAPPSALTLIRHAFAIMSGPNPFGSIHPSRITILATPHTSFVPSSNTSSKRHAEPDYICHSARGMAPANDNNGSTAIKGPHPSFVQVAKPYQFQQQLQGQLVAIGTNPTREDLFRLQGVQWINEVRLALQL